MTLALGTTEDEPPSPASPALIRHDVVNTGCTVPAAALTDRELADWVRVHSVSVIARDDRDLDLVQYRNIRPVQVVYRCGPATAALRRAVALGVSRFIVSTAQQMARIAESTHSTKYLHLDDQAPLMLGDKRLRVIGLHTEVGVCTDPAEWASSAQRLIGRAAVLKACGSTIKRITLSGGSTKLWLAHHDSQVDAIIDTVDRAVRDECRRRQLARPAVTLTALTAATSAARPTG